MSSKTRIRYGVLCEYIRREDNGKLILIGVFGNDIQVLSIPVTLNLSLMLSLETPKVGKVKLAFQVTLDSEVMIDGVADIEISEVGVTLLSFPNIPVTLSKEGILEVKVRQGSDDWQDIWKGKFWLRNSA